MISSTTTKGGPTSGKAQGQEKEKDCLSAGCHQMLCPTKKITKWSQCMEKIPDQAKEEKQTELSSA